jgi:hypothetical protein
MSPAIPYLLALAMHIALALLVWLAALMIAILPENRLLAKQIAIGMMGSFPGVFLFQLLCIPVLAIVLIGLNVASWFARPHDIIIVISVIVLMGLPLIASIRGFCFGWRIASEWALGRSPMRTINSDWLLGPISRILRKFAKKCKKAQQVTAFDGDKPPG